MVWGIKNKEQGHELTAQTGPPLAFMGPRYSLRGMESQCPQSSHVVMPNFAKTNKTEPATGNDKISSMQSPQLLLIKEMD